MAEVSLLRTSVPAHIRAETTDFVTIYMGGSKKFSFPSAADGIHFFHDHGLEFIHMQGLGGSYEVTFKKGPTYLGFESLGL